MVSASDREGRGVLAWLAAVVVALSPQHHLQARTTSARTGSTISALSVTRHVFGRRSRVAWCIAYYESRHELRARNGANLGPWQINVAAHPWADPWRLTHSWWYAARVAYRISAHGGDWLPWTTHALCGV